MIKKTKVSHNYISIAQKPCRGCRREESQDTLNQHSSLDTCIQVKGSRGLSLQDSKVGQDAHYLGRGELMGEFLSLSCTACTLHCTMRIAQCIAQNAMHAGECSSDSNLMPICHLAMNHFFSFASSSSLYPCQSVTC